MSLLLLKLMFNNTVFCFCIITATDVLNDIAWSAILDETFYNNYMNDSSLTWQYFASHLGFFRNYPGVYLDIHSMVWRRPHCIYKLALSSPLGKLADRAIYFNFRNFFLFIIFWTLDKLSQDLLDQFSRSLHQMISICLNMTYLDLFLIPQGTLPW